MRNIFVIITLVSYISYLVSAIITMIFCTFDLGVKKAMAGVCVTSVSAIIFMVFLGILELSA